MAKLSRRKMPGYSGQEGCTHCGCANNGTRHYGEEVHGDGINGFTGFRGPFCSAKCYRLDYPLCDPA